jgi:mannosyltransferase OCH1-like enzyme
MSIPKKIHYCWFGNNQKPTLVLQYIENWKTVLPDYDIIEWNEKNFDINVCDYTKQAYRQKKFAFVSDYVRLHALYTQGGIYLDTDVEVCKDPSEFIKDSDIIFGMEELSFVATSTMIAKPETVFIKKFMQSYHTRQFVTSDGNLDLTTNVENLTNRLIEIGLVQKNKLQLLEDSLNSIKVLPQEYFSPYDYINLIDNRSECTITVHHFGNSWVGDKSKIKRLIKRFLAKVVGGKTLKFFRRFSLI